MTKGLQSGLFKTAKKYKASPILLTPIFTANLMLSCFSNFGNPLPTPLIRGGRGFNYETKKKERRKEFFYFIIVRIWYMQHEKAKVLSMSVKI